MYIIFLVLAPEYISEAWWSSVCISWTFFAFYFMVAMMEAADTSDCGTISQTLITLT